MHEVSLVQNLFELIERYSLENRLQKVTRVVVRIGELSCVEPQSLQFAFAAIAQGTLAEHAEFVIEHVQARSVCTVCGHEFASNLTICTCPQCGKPAVFIQGQELHFQTLEGEQAEE